MWIKTTRGQLVDISGKCLTVDAKGALLVEPGSVMLTPWGNRKTALAAMERIERSINNNVLMCDLSRGEYDA